MINISVQITCVLESFNVWKLTWRNSCKSENTLLCIENGTTRTSGRYLMQCVVESFLGNSWYFCEIAAPIKAETSVFRIFRVFQNTLLFSVYLYICILSPFLNENLCSCYHIKKNYESQNKTKSTKLI